MTGDRKLLMSEHFIIFLKAQLNVECGWNVIVLCVVNRTTSLSWRLLLTCIKEALLKALNDATSDHGKQGAEPT